MPETPVDPPFPIASNDVAPQHGPRPLPLFLAMVWRETENDPELRQLAMTGLRRFQQATRRARTHPEPAFCAGERSLLLRVDQRSERGRTPVLLVPSLVNPPHILDLEQGSSLGRYLASRGHEVWLLDWGAIEPEHRDVGLAGHIEQYLLPALEWLGAPAVLVGYCLGGTMAMGAAAHGRAKAVAALATPWHFDRIPTADREQIASLWDQSYVLSERLGIVPMEVLQSGFWALDPQRTVRKFAQFATMAEGSDEEAAFIALEDWANEGEPLTFAAGRELFEDLYGSNMTGRGEWRVAGKVVDPTHLPCPALSIRSRTDRIVPEAASLRLREDMLLDLGHVGMVVSRRAPRMLWEPLADWIDLQAVQ